jgi:hypothetical protein
MPTGLTGIWPAAQGHIADPIASAWRVRQVEPTNGVEYTAGFLVSGKSGTGSGNIIDSRAWGRGTVLMRISGNSASASILASHDTASNIWVSVASYYTGQYTANCDNLIALEQAYPYLMGRVDFVSASGGVTASVWLYAHRLRG